MTARGGIYDDHYGDGTPVEAMTDAPDAGKRADNLSRDEIFDIIDLYPPENAADTIWQRVACIIAKSEDRVIDAEFLAQERLNELLALRPPQPAGGEARRLADQSHWRGAAEAIVRDFSDPSKKLVTGQKAAMLIHILLKAGAFDRASPPSVPDELRELSEKAAQTEWHCAADYEVYVGSPLNAQTVISDEHMRKDDAHFITAAVNYVRSLLSPPALKKGTTP